MSSASPSDTSNSLSLRCTKTAAEFPEAFLPYLQTEWKKYGASVEKVPLVMADLKKIAVLCQGGQFYPISKTYLPTTRLLFIHKRYVMNETKFPFLQLPQSLSPSNLGSWSFLEAHFDVTATDDLGFYLEMLSCIRYHNILGNVEYPRRVLELYLRIHAACKTSADVSAAQDRTREAFESRQLVLLSSKWIHPNDVVLTKPTSSVPRAHLLPPPAAWEATEGEVEELKGFYENTLGIEDFTWHTVLSDLTNRSYMPFGHLKSSYEVLDEMTRCLPEDSILEMKKDLTTGRYIHVDQGYGTTRQYKASDCIWSGGMKIPGKIDLSQHYPGLESFFTQFINVRKYKGGFIYKKLTTLSPTPSMISEVKQLLWSLNEEITESGPFLDPKKFRTSKIFPIRKMDQSGINRVDLYAEDARFFISDTPLLKAKFDGRIGMLDFTPHEVRRLEPLILWADLQSRYLSRNVHESTFLNGAGAKPQALKSPFTTARASGLGRVAAYFRSPRAKSASEQESLVLKLMKTVIFQTDGIYSNLWLNAKGSVMKLAQEAGDFHMEVRNDALAIYIPNGSDAIEFCYMYKLPRRMVEWIMTDPLTGVVGRIDDAAVGIVKSILNTKESLIDRILDAEGIFESHLVLPQCHDRPTTPSSMPVDVRSEVRSKAANQSAVLSTPTKNDVDTGCTWSNTPTPKNDDIIHKVGSLCISDAQAMTGSPKAKKSKGVASGGNGNREQPITLNLV